VDGTGSGSYLVEGFAVSSIQTSDYYHGME